MNIMWALRLCCGNRFVQRNPMDSSEEKAFYPFISPEKRTEKRTEKKTTGVSSDLQHLYCCGILYTLFLISCLHI